MYNLLLALLHENPDLQLPKNAVGDLVDRVREENSLNCTNKSFYLNGASLICSMLMVNMHLSSSC